MVDAGHLGNVVDVVDEFGERRPRNVVGIAALELFDVGLARLFALRLALSFSACTAAFTSGSIAFCASRYSWETKPE